MTVITNQYCCWYGTVTVIAVVGGRSSFLQGLEGPPLRAPAPAPPSCPRRCRLRACTLFCRPACGPNPVRPLAQGDMAGDHRLLLENAQQVVLVCTHGERFLAGDALRSLAVLEGASLVVGT